jgi:tRNA A-37 threonylcarbamoyl transferase component Bud32/ligand-binding sensor domain-containing protein
MLGLPSGGSRVDGGWSRSTGRPAAEETHPQRRKSVRMAGRRENLAEYTVRFLRPFLWMLLLPAAVGAQRYPILPVANSPHGIFTLFEDNHSRLWLGTIDDVYCFDGVNFYSLRQYGYPKETPNAYAEDSEGGIWIASQGTDVAGGSKRGSLYRYQAGHVERMLSGDGLSVVAPAPGIVLAAMGTEGDRKPSYGDLYRFRLNNGRWKPEELWEGTANHMTVDHGGNVLFPCPDGWCELTQNALRKTDSSVPGVPLQRHAGDPLSERILRDKFGCIWSRAEVRASYQCPGEPQPTHMPFDLSQIDTSAQLQEAADGSVFMLVPMILGRPGHFHSMSPLTLPTGLDTSIIARDGTIWVGSDQGLFRVPYPFQIEYWPQPARETTYPLVLRHVGERMYAGYSNLAFLKPDGRAWQPIPHSDNFQRNTDIVGLPDGRILASAVEGLTVYQGDQGKIVASLSTRDGNGKLARTNNGDLYLAAEGIDRIKIRGSHITLEPEPVPREESLDIAYDSTRDILWACVGKRLLFHKDESWHAITQADGLLDMNCGDIAIQTDGRVWLGYTTRAYALIEKADSGHPVVHNYTSQLDEVRANAGVYKLAADSRDRLWLGSSGDLNVATMDAARKEEWLPLNTQDGVGEMVPERQQFVTDKDGSVWFIGTNGVTHFMPSDDFASSFPMPHAFIAGIAVGASAPQLADAVAKLPRTQEITAEVGTVQFDRRNALHYRYRLLPEHSEWTQSPSTALHLGRLSWGTHTLQVQAQLSTGPWSAISERTMTVLKPFWLTWPAMAGFLVLGTGMVEGGRRWRNKRRERARKAFPELAELRLSALSPELQYLHGELLDGRFEVGHILARGGFATVTTGRDLKAHSRPCAIKIFRQELVDKEWMARRFQHEVLALEKIQHPNVVGIYGSGTLTGGGLYLVMEFIDGVTLRELLEIGKLAPERVASYLRQVGSALDAIHAHGICHRDLKPENLMIRTLSAPGEELVMIDFSIAIVKDPDETLHGLSRAAGTIYYMAPEQAIGYADASTDIYSLAKIVIEMLTGRRLSELLPNASMDLPARVRELLDSLPLRLGTVSIELISSALEFDPARRPQDAGWFANTIAADLQTEMETT